MAKKSQQCKKSSGKRMTQSQKDAKKLAKILKSSNWAVVSQWENFVPFGDSELSNELDWAKSQLLAFQQAHEKAKETKETKETKSPKQLLAELKTQQQMLVEEKNLLARQTTDEGRAARSRNVQILSERCREIEAELQSHAIPKEWKEWSSVPVKPLGFTVSKPKPKLKAKAKKAAPATAAKPITRAEIKAFRQRKAEEARLQRVENEAREAAKKAAAEYVAQRVSQQVKAAKAKAAAEKARKRAEAERRKAQEERLFNVVFELTMQQFDLDKMVREEVARQLKLS